MKKYKPILFVISSMCFFALPNLLWGAHKVLLNDPVKSNHKKVIMISGSNRGIGLAVARHLKQEGYLLSLGVRNTQSVPSDLSNCHTHYFESRDESSAIAWVNSCLDTFGHIDGVVHSAGIFDLWNLYDDEATLDNMLDVNMKGTLRLAKAALPSLRNVGDGRFINIVSQSGKRTLRVPEYKPYIGYAISKHAQLAVSKGILNEGYDDGVRVTSICSSQVNTDMPKKGPLYRPGNKGTRTEDIADIIALLLRMPNSAIIEEVIISCDWVSEALPYHACFIYS